MPSEETSVFSSRALWNVAQSKLFTQLTLSLTAWRSGIDCASAAIEEVQHRSGVDDCCEVRLARPCVALVPCGYSCFCACLAQIRELHGNTNSSPYPPVPAKKIFQSLLVPMTIDAEWILYHWEYLNIEAGELSVIVMRMRFERSFWLILFCNRRNRFRVKCVFTSSFRLRSRGSPAVIVAAVRAGRVFYKLLILTFLNISKWNISSCISKYT